MNERDQEFIEAMGAVVAEVGTHFVYPDDERTGDDQCTYVFSGRPSCLIGRAPHRVGIDINDLEQFEGSNASTVMEELGFDERVARAADWAQQKQDDRENCGVALDTFRETLTHVPLWY